MDNILIKIIFTDLKKKITFFKNHFFNQTILYTVYRQIMTLS